MKKKQEIRKNFVQESLDSYTKLATKINENTEDAVRNLLDEAVKNAYANILKEEDEDEDYDVEEVEDTEDINDEAEAGAVDDTDNEDLTDDSDADVDVEVETVETDDNADDEFEDGDDEEWEDFEQYKVDDDKYDLTNAEDDEVVKIYKRLKDTDDVIVKKNDDNIELTDNETGAEYLIQLNNDDVDLDDDEFDFEEDKNELDMNESRIFEIALDEYDSHVGYTDNYQKKDVMTTPNMTEPGKNVNDWDAGVPKGKAKPWSGKKGNKKENQPFDDEKGKQLEEGIMDTITDFTSDVVTAPQTNANKVGDKLTGGKLGQAKGNMMDAASMGMTSESLELDELKTRQEHTVNVGSTSRTDGDNGNRRRKARNFHTAQNGQETGTADNPYKEAYESVVRKTDKIFNENKQLKKALADFRNVLEEATVVNMNLGQIIKLISENTTSVDEKKEIIRRFGENAKTIEESKNLYETISNELQKKEKLNINENVNGATTNNVINETKIYQSQDLLKSLELMDKLCKR